VTFDLLTAVAVNGALAAAPGGVSTAMVALLDTPPAVLERMYAVRRRYDAVAVGTGTVLIDDPTLTSHVVAGGAAPVRVTLDRSGRIPRHARIFDGTARTLVGVVASTLAVILGTLAAIALVRFRRFRGRFLLTALVNAPLVMPEIITGITQLLLFVSMLQMFGWPHRGFTTIVLSHIAFCSAYVTITVQSRLQTADRSLEEAAMDLGSGPARAFLEITLPILAPAILSSWLLSFTLSLDDLVISSFVSGPGASTLPMVIYSKVKLGVSPDVNALASVIICAVGACVIAAGYFMRRADQRRALEIQMAEH